MGKRFLIWILVISTKTVEIFYFVQVYKNDKIVTITCI